MHLRLPCCLIGYAFYLLLAAPLHAQGGGRTPALLLNMLEEPPPAASVREDNIEALPGPAESSDDDRKFRARVTQLPLYDWWRHPGVSLSIGVNGAGFDVAEAVRDRINVRIGGEFLR